MGLRSHQGGRIVGSELPFVGQQRPHGAGILVGQRHGRHILVAPRHDLVDPAVAVRAFAGVVNDDTRAVGQQCSEVGV